MIPAATTADITKTPLTNNERTADLEDLSRIKRYERMRRGTPLRDKLPAES
jgi:hypothetical protein